jgi:hypothetical protein
VVHDFQMKRVYCAKDPLMVGHLRNVLVLHGIECVTRKLDLSSGAGELPPVECWPELWIVDEKRLAEAQAILKRALSPVEAVKKLWICSGCGEQIEGQFSECWNCGRERDEQPAPALELRNVSKTGRHT